MQKRGIKDVIVMALVVLFIGALTFGALLGAAAIYVKFKVWQKEKEGLAELKRAENARRVLVEQAKAEKEAAELRAQAIAIIGEMAKKYPEYRYQEFLGAFAEALKEGKIQQIIYVPTEANVPIMEKPRK